MLKVPCKCLLKVTVVNAVLFEDTDILGSFATDTVVLATERTGRWILTQILKLTDGSNIAILAVATQVSENNDCLVKEMR